MKRISTALYVIAIILSITPSAHSLDNETLSGIVPAEEKVYCGATIEDEFVPGEVLVVLTKRATEINKSYASTHFSKVKATEIEDLTHIENEKAFEWIDTENYNQILKITLVDKSKESVLKAIKILEQRDDVLSAEPNYIGRLDPLEVTPWTETIDNPTMNSDYVAEELIEESRAGRTVPNDPCAAISGQ